MPLTLQSKAFSKHAFREVVRSSVGLPERADLPAQVEYLCGYLAHDEMGTQTMLIEEPYVDRHFLTEYQGYYATALRQVPRHTTRLHLFKHPFRLQDVLQELSEADDDERAAVQDRLQQGYLGFIVLRPLLAAPVGRTVLRWFQREDTRCFGPQPPPHRVHILGLRLKAHGVQFHQQDQAVGACATAAIWCALAAVMRRDGRRSPTPLAVTEAATRSVPTSRALPAVAGLTLEQMVGAINAVGCSPDIFKPVGNDSLFMLQVMTYVRSGIPVVLQVREDGHSEGHAITVVGFRTTGKEDRARVVEYPLSPSRSLRWLGVTKLYVHDDRLGPYARVRWNLPTSPGEAKADEGEGENGSTLPVLMFDHGSSNRSQPLHPMRVWTAIAPLYPKIRISAGDLLRVAMEVWPVASHLAGEDRRNAVILETCFTQSGHYLREVHTLPMEGARRQEAISTLVLSRYVGVLRFRTGDDWLLDIVCDATDIYRESVPWSTVLAMLTSDPVSPKAKPLPTSMPALQDIAVI